jgi:hypothetical protein
MTSNSTRFLWKALLPLAGAATLAAWVWLQPNVYAQTSDAQRAGAFEKIKVHGSSLEGNLEGDPAERDVFVYLPPSYASQPNRR